MCAFNSKFVLSCFVTEHEDAETGQSSLSLDMLADDLRQLVLDDNQRFADEMKKWDEDESQRAMAVSTTAEDVTIVGESTGGMLVARITKLGLLYKWYE